MEDKNAEMSLDEVLSSIKKMVIDEEPPVLELTDMISEDGSIVKIQKNIPDSKTQDMGSFLKLIQENQDNGLCKGKKEEVAEEKIEPSDIYEYHGFHDVANTKNDQQKDTMKKKTTLSETNDVISDLIKEMLTPILQQWINDNLQKIVSSVVEKEVKNFLYNRSKQ